MTAYRFARVSRPRGAAGPASPRAPLLLGLALALTAGCNNPDALLLLIAPPSGVQLTQYEVRIQDRDSRTLIYQSGVQPIAAVSGGRDLSADPLRLGMKLSQPGKLLIFVRASTTQLLPDGSVPSQRTSEYFFASITQISGTTEVNANLLEVQPSFDRDFDHFPDSMTWPAANVAAKVQYQNQLEALDCVDQDPAPGTPALPAGLFAVEINPLATPRCGLPLDVSCGMMAPACKDADGDGESEATDCDDHDPNRFHGNPRPRNCCNCTDHTSCATDHSQRTNLAECQPARCDLTYDFNCTGVVVPCFVDNDCDGYSPNDPNPSQADCDDNNPDVHPGAVKKCADPSHDWACDHNPRGGCVACDLDGDGYQRLDATAGCPDQYDIHPGKFDCDDTDRGVFPGSTSTPGATLIGKQDLNQSEGGGSTAAALRRLCYNKGYDGATPQDADCDGKPQNGCPPASAGGKPCDVDGDGFPNSNPGCNPGNLLPLDCDDNDYKTFPGAPDYCGDNKEQNCAFDTACSMDADNDHYNADVDCDDHDPTRHPFANELCNGVDDDCDGLIDELNPDPSGTRLTETHGAVTGIRTCTDSNIGDCGLPAGGPFPGRCVCSAIVPGQHAPDAMRTACPGTRDDATTAPKCFGATQPGLQTCKASTPNADQDCDGRTDAPDGKNLKEYGDVCGVSTGTCVAGTVVGCDHSKINPFSQTITPGHPVTPAFDPDRKFLVCDANAVYPSLDVCDGKDNDCDGIVDDCTGGGIKTPQCCPGVNMCLDLSSNFNYCGTCTGACSAATANACVNATCMCGNSPACSGALGYCKSGTTCVQCLADANCSGGTPRCDAANVCVQCLVNADCSGATPACNTTTHLCVPCTANSDCSGMAATPVCKTTVNQCVQCVANSDCGAGLQCNTANNTCVQCVDNTGCGGATPVCKTAVFQCVQCVANSDCGAGMQCNTANNTCVQCVDNTGCGGATPVCKTAAFQCVQCLVNADCGAGKQCNTMNNTCVQCVDNTGCGGATPVCKTAVFQCVQCLANADCGAGKQCDTTTNTCVQCVDDTGCSGATPYCNTGTHTCVACNNDAECMSAAAPKCDPAAHVCRQCLASADCSGLAATPVCDTSKYQCVQCLASGDCAMVAGKPACDTTSEKCVQCVSDGDCTGMTPRCSPAEMCVQCLSDADCGAMTCNLMTYTCM